MSTQFRSHHAIALFSLGMPLKKLCLSSKPLGDLAAVALSAALKAGALNQLEELPQRI